VADTPILVQIKKFIELQKIDAQIYTFKRDLHDKPALLNELHAQFDAKKSGWKALEEQYKGLQLHRKGLEGELKAQEEAIAKANAQLSLLKTNREYTAKMSEIEVIKAAKSKIEEKILLSYDYADKVNAQMDQEQASLATDEAEYLKTKAEIEFKIKELDDKQKVLLAQRSQALEGLEKVHLQRYDRILSNKDGLAIVPLQNGVCGGCYMNVPPQVVNEIKMHEHLVYCEMCARILYLEDEIG